MSTSDSEDGETLGMFEEPEDFYPPSPKPTTATYTMLSGVELSIRLVGHNPLWGHHLWNAGRVIARHLEQHREPVEGRTVLELGAGAGLPSLLSGILGAKRVVVTDYPDPDLIENLKYNISNMLGEEGRNKSDIREAIKAEGYLWGADPSPLLQHIEGVALPDSQKAFDVLILADLLFNHSEHTKLVSTVQQTLKRSTEAKALVFFTPYRPWLLEKDLAFFDLVRDAGFEVEKILEEKMEKVMFEDDPGDEEIRRTVFGYVVKWKKEELISHTKETSHS
jgi:nicotinamide N-methyltransferase